MRRLLIATAVTGFVLNLTGWAGNVFLLGSMWEQAGTLAPAPMRSPFSPTVHVALQFVSDFVFAFVLCLIYRLAVAGWRGANPENPRAFFARVSLGWVGSSFFFLR